jgi:hypothetical protein
VERSAPPGAGEVTIGMADTRLPSHTTVGTGPYTAMRLAVKLGGRGDARQGAVAISHRTEVRICRAVRRARQEKYVQRAGPANHQPRALARGKSKMDPRPKSLAGAEQQLYARGSWIEPDHWPYKAIVMRKIRSNLRPGSKHENPVGEIPNQGT